MLSARMVQAAALIDGMSKDELTEVSGLIRDEWKKIDEAATDRFSAGDLVEFEGKGRPWGGQILYTNSKTVKVKARPVYDPQSRPTEWRVAGTYLRPMSEFTKQRLGYE